jgi:galactose mutarotase-like enzyme
VRKAPDKPFGSAELRAGETRVVIAPALGGKITTLEMGGRDWLWRNERIPFAPPQDGAASWAETGDSGGYDECFPTVGACTIPSWIPRYGGLELPEHGELWSQSAAFELETQQPAAAEGSGLCATCVWTGERMPYRFERTVFVEPSGAVVMRYTVTNEGQERLPFIWSAHPIFPLTPDTRLILPEGARVRVYAQHGIELFGSDAEHVWPRLLTPSGVVDMSHPDTIGKRFACKLFFDMKGGYAAIEEGDARLQVTFDVSEVPNFGLWINKRGVSPFRRRRPYTNFGFEPAIGAPDTLSDALGAWNSAHWLEGGETRRWSLRWQGERIVQPVR